MSDESRASNGIRREILDVGCGGTFKGDVNVDLYANPTEHRPNYLIMKKIPNFVLADAQHLPFRNKTFDEVTSSHVIEHVEKPMLMVKEMCRISKEYVNIRCPHRLWLGSRLFRRNKGHKHRGFNASWFKQAFANLHWKVITSQVTYGLFGTPDEVIIKATYKENIWNAETAERGFR
jgi:SAM-dependent methyltransferase